MAFNKVIIAGNLVNDPELKQTQNGVAVTSFRIAVNRRFDKKTTDFIDIVCWRSAAEFVCKFFKKGKPILVCGELQTRTWQDNNGNKRYATEVVADEVSFFGGKEEKEEQSQPMTYGQAASYQPQAVEFSEMTNDEDLPF